MSIVDVSSVSDGFDHESILASVPGQDRTIVASPDLVVRIAREALDAVFGPLGGLVDLVHHPVGDVIVAVDAISDTTGVDDPFSRRLSVITRFVKI